DIFVESANGDMYAANDQLIDKIDRQVVKHMERLQTHAHVPLKHQQAAEQIELPPLCSRRDSASRTARLDGRFFFVKTG
ncbi:HPF/RaiA family ribosome-associated protein, partial [Burkholderia pseudomallei]